MTTPASGSPNAERASGFGVDEAPVVESHDQDRQERGVDTWDFGRVVTVKWVKPIGLVEAMNADAPIAVSFHFR